MDEHEINNHRINENGIPYNYYCRKCGYNEDLYYHMIENRPKEYNCPQCKTKNSMIRQFADKVITIPFQWTTDDSPKFETRPSGKRKLHPVEKDIK